MGCEAKRWSDGDAQQRHRKEPQSNCVQFSRPFQAHCEVEDQLQEPFTEDAVHRQVARTQEDMP